MPVRSILSSTGTVITNSEDIIRNLQISLGFPDLRDTSSLPRLKLVLMGIQHLQSHSRVNAARICLPITFSILGGIKNVWEDAGVDHNRLLMWAAATVCFFRFFRSGEITVPSAAAFTHQFICRGATLPLTIWLILQSFASF